MFLYCQRICNFILILNAFFYFFPLTFLLSFHSDFCHFIIFWLRDMTVFTLHELFFFFMFHVQKWSITPNRMWVRKFSLFTMHYEYFLILDSYVYFFSNSEYYLSPPANHHIQKLVLKLVLWFVYLSESCRQLKMLLYIDMILLFLIGRKSLLVHNQPIYFIVILFFCCQSKFL